MTPIMMIDIETLSLRPDAFVTQVGAVVADRDTGDELASGVWWLGEAGQEGRHKDFATIQWWMNQDKRVADGVFTDTVTRHHPDELFNQIAEDITKYEVQEVWASPAMFDLPILTSLWGGRKPWVYNQERCLMTLYKLLDPHGLRSRAARVNHHDALADARWQMDYLTRILGAAKFHADTAFALTN